MSKRPKCPKCGLSMISSFWRRGSKVSYSNNGDFKCPRCRITKPEKKTTGVK